MKTASNSTPPASEKLTSTPVRKRLSPRGRGAVPAPLDEDRLLRLFAENMRVVRLQRELSQEALGDLCDLDRTYISSIERKRRNVSIRNIQRIADALSVDARALLDPDLSEVKVPRPR